MEEEKKKQKAQKLKEKEEPATEETKDGQNAEKSKIIFSKFLKKYN